TERLLSQMKEDSEKMNAHFLLAVAAPQMAVNPDVQARARYAAQMGVRDLSAFESRLTDISRRSGIDLLTLGPPMLERATRTNTCLYGFANAPGCNGHFNPAGHGVVAELLASRICADLSGSAH